MLSSRPIHDLPMSATSIPHALKWAPGTSRSLSEVSSDGIQVELTDGPIDIGKRVELVRSPEAGAIVSFAGTTRNNFRGEPVKQLQYEAYRPRALRTMWEIASQVKDEFSLTAIAIIHRLGVVPISEESVFISVSAPHRQAAWKGAEAALELCKDKVEIWKQEEFFDRPGEWRENQKTKADGSPISDTEGIDDRT